MRNCKYHGKNRCRECWLYVVADRDGTGPVKVGISFSPVHRLSQHRKKTGRDLRIHYRASFPCEFEASDAEDSICKSLEIGRVRGDWFDIRLPDVIAAASKVVGKTARVSGCHV